MNKKFCDFCNKDVSTKLSQGQLIGGMYLTILFIIPGIIYMTFAHRKTCVVCGNIVQDKVI